VSEPSTPTELDTSIAHPARVYDYWLGGKDNFPADRAAAEAVLAANPAVRLTVRENRAFLRRVVRYLTAEAGIRQFLDIGTGIPTSPNVHEVAQQVAPDARAVYVDNDPIVLAHARALLAGSGAGTTTVIQADLREPDSILQHPQVRQVLDFGQPLGILLVAVLHHLTDEDDPAGVVARLRDAAVGGSYLAISHGTADINPEAAQRAAGRFAESRTAAPYVARSHATIEGFFDGLELLDPGVVQPPLWRPDGPVSVDLERVSFYAGLGRKP
jgi:S-adenosyl methyltransferase